MTSEEDDKIMKLERNIPARKEIIKFGWVRKDFLRTLRISSGKCTGSKRYNKTRGGI